MRRLLSLLVAGLVFAGCAEQAGEEEMPENAASEEVAAPSADEAAIEEIRASYVQHYNLHHAPVVADLYADSSVALLADGGIQEGKAEILAWLEGTMAGTPTLELTTIDKRVFGDYAVAIGEYSVQATPPGGAATTSAGHYLTLFERGDAGWKIDAVITNFNAPPPADFPWAADAGEAPPEDGTMKALTDSWAQHYNLGHANVVAGLYEADARASFSDSPMLNGPAEIEATLAQRIAEMSPQITIHDVYTLDLGDGYALDAGWYEMTTNVQGTAAQRTGTYVLLVHQQADGSHKILWHVSNGHPAT